MHKQCKHILIAIALVGAAVVITFGVSALRQNTSFMVFSLAVVISARIGGIVPSILAAITSCLAWSFFIANPTLKFSVSNDDLVRLVVFVSTSLLVGSLFSSREKARLNAEDSERRLNLALQAAGLAIWGFDVNTNKLWASDGFKTIWGVETDTDLTMAKLQALVHPEDREKFIEAVAECLDKGKPFDITHRLSKKELTIHTVGILKSPGPSKPVSVIGFATCDNLTIVPHLIHQ